MMVPENDHHDMDDLNHHAGVTYVYENDEAMETITIPESAGVTDNDEATETINSPESAGLTDVYDFTDNDEAIETITSPESDSPTSPLSNKRRGNDVVRPHKRTRRSNSLRSDEFKPSKRQLKPDLWIANVQKIRRNTNKGHINYKGQPVAPREMRPACDENCRFRCYRLRFEQRKACFDAFWKIDNYDDKLQFLTRLMTVGKKKSCRDEYITSQRQNTCEYFLHIDEKRLRVCKMMFLNTFSISHGMTSTITRNIVNNKLSKDQRGAQKNAAYHSTSPTIQSIRDHVYLFETVPAHYVRKDSKRLYLEQGLSCKKMYDLYLDWMSTRPGVNVASERQYRDTFNKDFNIGFFVPKKDQCNTCTTWKINEGNPEIRTQLLPEFEVHNVNRQRSRDLKAEDKLRARKCPELCVAVFDLEKTLNLPKAETNLLYYKRKLAMYNCTVYDLGNTNGYCYIWTEDIGKRGSNDVASCVLDFIGKQVENGKTEFILYSDNCGGQNKNRFMFSMFAYASALFRISITHRFLECGHTQNEGDSMHSAIESASRYKDLYTPDQWMRVMEAARPSKPYNVIQISQNDIFDFKDVESNINMKVCTDGIAVPWSKVREVSVRKEEMGKMFVKINFDDEQHMVIDLNEKKGTPNCNLGNLQLKNAFNGNLGVPSPKLRDLLSMCDELRGIIPPEHRGFYLSLRPRNSSEAEKEK